MAFFWPAALQYKNATCSGPHGSSLPLTGPLNWGTVQISSLTGTGIMKGAYPGEHWNAQI